MAHLPAWPSYDIGPPGSALALGVASVNYAGLEWAFGSMFAQISGRSSEQTWPELRKMRSNNDRIKRIRSVLHKRDWPDDLKDKAAHFIKAFEILTDNRNLLDHSDIFRIGTEEPISLYKYDKDGKTIHILVTLEQVRKVADDMRMFTDYGVTLVNAISLEAAGSTLLLPASITKPPLPQRLEYTSEPLPLTRSGPPT
jgi:hypothetical protein